MKRTDAFRLGSVYIALAAVPAAVLAQADEIQVYDAGLSPVGVFNLTWHSNYTPNGVRTPAFPGGVVSHHALVGVTEWAYGVTDWFEAGLYLPLYSIDEAVGGSINGAKLRALFAVPHADDRTFFYGLGFELSYNATEWDANRITSEIRPILGWHLDPWDIVFNPILDTAYDGLGNLEFAPSARLAYNVSPTFAVAVEQYADFGPVNGFVPGGEQGHQIYGVVDRTGGFMDIEAGIGFGLTDASDRVTLKLILSRDLN